MGTPHSGLDGHTSQQTRWAHPKGKRISEVWPTLWLQLCWTWLLETGLLVPVSE